MNSPYMPNERGSALLIALLLMMMLSMLAVVAVDTSNTDMSISHNQSNSNAAFYNAEAGAKRAFIAINEDDAWRAGYNNVTFGNGTYSAVLIDSTGVAALDDTVVIRATGNIRDAESQVELWTAPVYIYPFRFAMFGNSWINMDQATCTDSYNSDSGTYAATVLNEEGSLGTNGNISTSKLVDIGGDAFTANGGSITLGAGSHVAGDTSTTRDSVNLDIIPQSEYDWAASVSNALLGISGTGFNYNNGAKTLTVGANSGIVLQSGVYYFSSITMGQNSSISLAPGAEVMIYMTGDVNFNQGSTVNAGGNPSSFQMFSKSGTLQFDQDNIFYGTFYGPNSHIQYDQTTQVYGSLVGNTIQLDKGACFHYDRNLANVRHGTTGEMRQVAWKEL